MVQKHSRRSNSAAFSSSVCVVLLTAPPSNPPPYLQHENDITLSCGEGETLKQEMTAGVGKLKTKVVWGYDGYGAADVDFEWISESGFAACVGYEGRRWC